MISMISLAGRRAAALSIGLCVGVGLMSTTPCGAQTKMTGKEYTEDFDALWKEIADSYAYFDRKETDWNKVKEIYRPLAAKVHDRREFVTFLEQVTEELYDFHCNLNTNIESSPVLVPTDADLWAEWRNGRAIITDVRPDSPADKAKIRPGAEVLTINGVEIRKAVAARMGRCLRKKDVAAENWALQTLLAGRHNAPQRRIELLTHGKRAAVTLDSAHRDYASLLDSRTVGENGEIGYIRPNNSLGDTGLIAAFDTALESLKNARGLLLDLRETPSGGNTVVARAVMGRFLDREMFYQKHSIPAEERAYGVRRSWVEIVSPRGPFRYENPVVVLVNHWTGSMGEGITLGLDATKRAQIVGVEMARLLGATDGVTLPNTQITVHFPTEKVFHPNGTPRENFLPGVYVNLLAGPSARAADPIFEAGMKTLRKRIKPGGGR